MGDEDVFRRKLMVDGDGMGDDRRVTTLMRTFIKWCIADEKEDECKITYERMLAVLAQCESTMVKSRLTSAMNQEEMCNYEALCTQIASSIDDAHNKIGNCKISLNQAKQIRKNRQEYDVLAKTIQQHPDRCQTTVKLQHLDSELHELKKKLEILGQKLNLRRKHFSVLRSAIHELQLLLEVDEAEVDIDMKNEEMDTL